MIRIVVIITLIILGGCTHKNGSGEIKNGHLSDLGVVLLDYDDEHLELTVNGNKVLDEVVYSFQGGSGVSTQFVIKTPRRFAIKFCVNGDCLEREFSRSENDIYLAIYRAGPIATHPPYIELSRELEGLD